MADCRQTSFCEDGYHWFKPDQRVGTELQYGFRWTAWLTRETNTLDTVTWTIPTGLTNLAESVNGTEVFVLLRADTVGVYEISCTITTVEGQEQTKTAKLEIY